MRLFRSRPIDGRMYILPSVDEVAALIVGDFDSSDYGRDIILRTHDGDLQKIKETDVSFIPLQYALLFPFVEDGYQEHIPLTVINSAARQRSRVRAALREFIAYRLFDRASEEAIFLRSKRLFQQFVVDSYSMVETKRLLYIKLNQSTIRGDYLRGVEEAIDKGDVEAMSIGKCVVLPSLFSGSRRYMFNNCQDAMTICKKYGYPDLFLTFTCNPKWDEIYQFVHEKGLIPYDCSDICKVFHMKLHQLMTDFKKGKFFGKVIAERGLPHAHILLWLEEKDNLQSINFIDSIISAELLDKGRFPNLYHVVSNFMLRGPCGNVKRTSPCMKAGKCTKFFSKRFVNDTTFDVDDDGYLIYRRRDTSVTVTKGGGVELDNQFVMPYNPKLLMRYRAHINIEYCNKSDCIKYLFKYVNKGPYRVTVAVIADGPSLEQVQMTNEIKQYYDCQYLSPCESVWRLFAFNIRKKWPIVQRLAFHLPMEQFVTFNDNERISDVFERNKDRKSLFQAWMEANCKYCDGRNLTYVEFPSKFVYFPQERDWRPRKKGQMIGWLNFVPPGTRELYYMRLLLNIQKCCKSYKSLRMVNNETEPTFQGTCSSLGLLSDDKEFVDEIREVALLASGLYLRRLFVTLLLSNIISSPSYIREETWELLADKILYDRQKILQYPGLSLTEAQLKLMCLVEVEKLLQINEKSLKDFYNMPYPNCDEFSDFNNLYIVREINYDINEMIDNHANAFNNSLYVKS